MKIMIVEDDQVIREVLSDILKKWEYEIVMIETFEAIIDDVLKEKPNIILLDINLPTFDGFYWCQKIREFSKIPIIFISSRNSSMDMVMAMNMGGDDFIQKPFDTNVLMAKINALLRRTYSYVELQVDTIEHDGVCLNLDNWHIKNGEQEIELTKTEFTIFHLLMKQTGTILSRNKIIRALWKAESFIDDNTLTVNVNRLRKKLAQLGKTDFIITKKGEGYGIL